MANKNIFKVDAEYIELMALLKAVGIAQTGGHAKMIVDEGNVLRNGEVELRRRAKCRKGDEIQVNQEIFTLM
jgi:ribosome-associated protein